MSHQWWKCAWNSSAGVYMYICTGTKNDGAREQNRGVGAQN